MLVQVLQPLHFRPSILFDGRQTLHKLQLLLDQLQDQPLRSRILRHCRSDENHYQRGVPVSAKAREQCECLSGHFSTITHTSSSSTPVSDELYTQADVTYRFPVNKAPVVVHVPRLKFIQLTSTGVELLLNHSQRIPILPVNKAPVTAHMPRSKFIQLTSTESLSEH